MPSTSNRLVANSDIFLAVGVVLILMVMIFPLPTVIMDLLLALNLATGLLILMVSMYLKKPLQFSVFPGLLLIITLFRLSLNVASTRLILGQAYAGKIILAFGDFVVKGNYIVGMVIFLILVIINFVVITKGAGRVAEVAARFTLDSMPGKQMSIDADLNSGLIDEAQARARRLEISAEADFYGSMDGASKFVRGDAVAGLVITILNIVGGFIIGVAQHGMPLGEAARTYTRLTVGDGLVSQIPALIISTAAGLVVTRTATESSFGEDLTSQMLHSPRAIFLTSGVLFLLGFTPGLPMLPFLILGTAMGSLGYMMRGGGEEAEEIVEERPKTAPEEAVEDYLRVDPLELEIGYSLIPMVDQEQGGDLLVRITQLRKQLASEIGLIIPPVRIRDNIQLKPNDYVIRIKGIEAARGELMVGRYLALNPGTAEEQIAGVQVQEPAFGLPATWITENQKEQAELSGYTIVETVAVLTTHLLEVLKTHANQILGRQEVSNLLDTVKKDQPALVEEVVPNLLSLGSVEKVLQNLLRERVSIRNLPTILEVLADTAHVTKDPDVLTEYVRQNLSETVVRPYVDDKNTISAITLDAGLERSIANMLQEISSSKGYRMDVSLPPDQLQALYTTLAEEVEGVMSSGSQPVVITSPGIRLAFRKLIEAVFPNVIVLSYGEIPSRVQVQTIGKIRIAYASEAV